MSERILFNAFSFKSEKERIKELEPIFYSLDKAYNDVFFIAKSRLRDGNLSYYNFKDFLGIYLIFIKDIEKIVLKNDVFLIICDNAEFELRLVAQKGLKLKEKYKDYEDCPREVLQSIFNSNELSKNLELSF